MKTSQRVLVLICALSCLAWTDIPRSQVVEGNRLFHEGKFGDAIEQYGQGLVDHPDSPVLNFNMGTAHYKAGKYSDALSSFSRVQPESQDSDKNSNRTARTAYNAGNAYYKMGASAQGQNPQAALAAYSNALAAYRRALGADPTDQDAKFNYEFVTKKIEELQEKMQNQPQQNQQDQQSPQDQQNQQDQQSPQEPQQSQGQNQDQQQDQQQAGQNDKQQQQEQQQANGQEEDSAPDEQEQQAGQSPQERQNDMSSDEAQSVIDTARNEELSPEEFARQVQRGTVAEAVRDW